jgi:hypothetical protein
MCFVERSTRESGAMAESGDEGRALVAGLKGDLAKWRERLAGTVPGGGFDVQRSLISAWIKEGQRLLDRLEADLKD